MLLLKKFVVLIVLFCLFNIILTYDFYADEEPQKITNKSFETPPCVWVPLSDCNDVDNFDMHEKPSRKVLKFVPRIIDGSSEEVCCKNPATTSNEINSNEYNFKCGQPLITINQNQIFSGHKTVFGEGPWNLVILKYGQSGNYVCGASLIHPEVALTAAHCVEDYAETPFLIFVRAGAYDFNNIKDFDSEQDLMVDDIVIHKTYKHNYFENDIALLFLSKPAKANANINTICLPTSVTKIIGNRCVVSGWNRVTYRNKVFPNFLRKTEVQLINTQDCLDFLREEGLGSDFKLADSGLCALDRRSGCYNVGGSPLICPEKDQDNWVQIGIVSYRLECERDDFPGIYTNVFFFVPWIENEMKLRDLKLEERNSI